MAERDVTLGYRFTQGVHFPPLIPTDAGRVKETVLFFLYTDSTVDSFPNGLCLYVLVDKSRPDVAEFIKMLLIKVFL